MSIEPDFVKLKHVDADIEAQFNIDRDNQIQDLLHERIDAQRPSGGQTLEQFLASDAK